MMPLFAIPPAEAEHKEDGFDPSKMAMFLKMSLETPSMKEVYHKLLPVFLHKGLLD